MADKIKFWPIRGTEEQVKAQPYYDGKIYFTTDTNKIYLDVNGDHHLMGGGGGNGSGITYAHGTESQIVKASGSETDNNYFIDLEALDDSSVAPMEDDLILNSDGRFFRVVSYDSATKKIAALLLAVSGSGGGGGDTVKRRYKINLEKPNPSTLINGQRFLIYFTVESAIDQNDNILDNEFTAYVTLSEKVAGTTDSYINYYSTQKDVANDIRSYFDITEFLRESTTTRITIYAKGVENGDSRSYSTDVTTTALTLNNSASFSNLSTFASNSVNLSCEAIGRMDKILNFYFDGELVESRHLTATSTETQTYKVSQELATQGSHSVRITLSQARINTTTDEWEVLTTLDPLEFEIAVYDSSSENLTPIIWLGNYQNEYYNYDNIQIPFMVYNPASPASALVHLKKNGQDIAGSPRTISTDASTRRSWNIFEIADADVDMLNYYSISCGATERTITFTVSQDPNRSMELMQKDNLILCFDATGRSNAESESNRILINDAITKQNIPAKFTNFNWYNNGWVLDNNRKACLRISNGASLEIPFGSMELNDGGHNDKQSVTFEMEFKVRNVQSYDNLVSNITRYEEDEEYYQAFISQERYNNYDSFLHDYLPTIGKEYDDLKFRKVQKDINTERVVAKYYSGTGASLTGFGLGPQDAFFSNGTDTVNISFIEDKVVNFSMVFSYPDQRLYIYNNGVITGVIANSVNGIFTIATDKLIFNSTYCDIDLYKFRVYKTALNVNEIVQNYAVDKKDIDIYDQNALAKANSVLGEYQFDYQAMLDYNEAHPNSPLMPYVIYDTSRQNSDQLSYAKKIKLPIDFEFVNTPLELAYRNGELLSLAIADGLCTANSSAADKEAAVKEYYLHHCPSFISTNAEMAVQGTSSQFYPRRNYKIKTETKFDQDGEKRVHIYLNRGPFLNDFLADQELTKNFTEFADADGNPYELKSAQKFFYMDNYIVGTTKFTMKIDFMESSGTYNTGFANLVDNAYSKHPLKDYNAAGAFSKLTGYAKATGDFNLKETYYADEKGKEKVKLTAETYVPNTYYIAQYSPYQFDHLNDYRTSVQGFRTLAFHKKKTPGTSGSQYEFIGMYNMNIDKGSDEIYGFKADKSIVNNFLKKKTINKTAECWEFENNSRTFCSFRDPWDRYELSFKGPDAEWFAARPADYPNGSNALNGALAPVVVDSFEYRYNTNDDFIDLLVDTSTAINSTETVAEIKDEFDVDIYNNAEAAGDLILDLYKNWEKAVKWVWSTSTKDIASLGTYNEVAVGNEWIPNTYWILDEENSYQPIPTEGVDEELWPTTGPVYILDTGNSYNPNLIYRKKVTNAEGVEEYVNAFVSDIPYRKNTYYLKNADGTYVLAADDFDESLTYYQITEYTEEELATKAARLVEKDTDGVFDANAEYYEYDGSVQVRDIATGVDTPTKKAVVTASNYEPDKYYKGISIVYNGKEYKYDTQEYRSAKFFNELSDHFDIEYMAAYVIMTEVFECYDSRGKNLMMASWGPQKEGGDYIWYPIFYDIDTQLGINNTGIPSFAFNVDATEAGNYSTSDSILWMNFYNQFKKSYVLQKYRHLKGITTGVPSSWGRLDNPPLQSIDFIEKWYETDPTVCNSIVMRGERPMIATNLDEWYKYLTITNPSSIGKSTGETGYMNDSGTFIDDNGKNTYFYALQGDRSQSRQQFLSNRIEYIDSWLNEGNYQRGGANRIRGRVAANNPSKTSDQWVASAQDPYFLPNGQKAHEFDAEYWINLTPVRSSYVTLSDDNEAYPSEKYDGINPVKFNIDAIENGVKNSANYPEQLLYIYGMNQMADLGEMHNLYWQEFELSGDARKLTTLKLGYDGKDENGNSWYNKNMNLPTIPGKKPEDESGLGLPLLQEVNLSNITINTGSPTLDLTSCEKLKNLRATGSNYQNFSFAEGVALDTLYLPTDITQLQLTEANLLTNLLTDYEAPTRNATTGKLEARPGLYLEGMFENNKTNISNIRLIGGGLGYDSYKLLAKWYSIKDALDRAGEDIGSNQVTMTKVKWSPYVQLLEGDTYNAAEASKYYVDNGHYGFTPYSYNRDTFEAKVLSGEIYKLNTDISADIINQITNVDMLAQMITNRHYSAGSVSVPNITGIIYVNNGTPIDELYVKNTLVKNYPQLKFFFANVNQCYSAKFVLPTDNGGYTYVKFQDENITELTIQKISADQWFENPYTLYKAEKDNYDFHGWSTTLDDSGLISSEDWASAKSSIFNESQKDYTFYAVFTLHEYEMSFYVGQDLVKTMFIPFGSVLSDPQILPSYTDANLGLTEVYKHLGWTQNEKIKIVERASQANLVDFSKMLSVQDYRFYAVFKKQSVRDEVTDLKYFDFEEVSYDEDVYFNELDAIKDTSYNVSRGYKINIKNGIKLSGKITLPSYYNGLPVIAMGGSFVKNSTVDNEDITHIFWRSTESEPCMLRALEDAGSGNSNKSMKLSYIEIPEGTRIIYNHYFRMFNCIKTITPVTSNPIENSIILPSSLAYIGQYSFLQSFTGNINLIRVPGSVGVLGRQAFANQLCSVDELEIGSSDKPSELYLVENQNLSNNSVTISANVYNTSSGATNNITFYCKDAAWATIYEQKLKDTGRFNPNNANCNWSFRY